MPSDTTGPRGAIDPGLSPERTTLSWARTALSLAVLAALIIKAGANGHVALLAYIMGAILLLLAACAWAHGRRVYPARRDALATHDDDDRRSSADAVLQPTALRATAAVTTIAAAVALVVIIVSTVD